MDQDEPIPITNVFDLSSIPAGEAEAAVEKYVEEAHRLGIRKLRIVHGVEIDKQSDMVRSLLIRIRLVSHFYDATADTGAWGGTVVKLRETDAHNNLEQFIDQVEGKQRNVFWPDTLANGISVDKGLSKAPLTQRSYKELGRGL